MLDIHRIHHLHIDYISRTLGLSYLRIRTVITINIGLHVGLHYYYRDNFEIDLK